MPTSIWTKDFEDQSLADCTLTGVPTIQSTHKNSGTYAMQAISSSSDVYASRALTETAILVGRFYIRFSTLYTSDWENYIRFLGISSNPLIDVAPSGSGGYFGFYEVVLGDVLSNVVATTATWFYIDFKINDTAHTFDWQINGSPQTQRTIGTVGNIYGFQFGCLGNTSTTQFDDIALSVTAGDYPIGPVAGGGSTTIQMIWTR